MTARWFFVGVTSFILGSCVTSGEGDLFQRVEVENVEECGEVVDLATDVLPEIDVACGFCHVSGSFGELNFADGSGVLTPDSFVSALVDQPSLQSEKPLIESGSELGSYFVDRVLQRESSLMPPAGPPLSDEAIQALRCWVEQGASLEVE